MPGELVSGIDYLKELGVTTVQLAPFADFDGDSEYEILNYNVPEASYASNPSDSKTVIKECKEMIQALHSAGIFCCDGDAVYACLRGKSS